MRRIGIALALLSMTSARGQTDASALSNLTRLQMFETRRESSANEDLAKNGDARPIEPGETLVLGNLEGPGVITHIWTTVGSEDPLYQNSLVVRIYYDGMEKPSVEAPYGDFFGIGHGASVDMQSAVITASAYGRARNCWWHMPFRERAKVTVTNESKVQRTNSFYYYVDWQKHTSLPDDIAYFHAQYRQAYPAQPGPYVVLDTQGRGHFAGVVYSVLQTQIGWFGEGDDRFYIDGAERPRLSGTGTEDYFCDAWGFHEFSYPYYGVPIFEGYMAGDRVSAYRWHVADPISFSQSLRFEMEHHGSLFTDSITFLGQFYERPDWIDSVAFWYQTPAKELSEPLPALADRLPPYRVIMGPELTSHATPETGVTKDKHSVAYMPGKPDAKIAFDFAVDQPGHYRIRAIMGHGFMGSMYQAQLDGNPIGPPHDFYVEDNFPKWVDFDNRKFEAGTHTLAFEGLGASPNHRKVFPQPYALQLYALVLLRMEDVAGYMEAANKALAEVKTP